MNTKKNIEKNKKNEGRGFTLLEIVIAVSIFSIISILTTGSFLSLNSIKRESQAANDVLNELRFAIDLMGQEVSSGSAFPDGCSNGCDSILFASKVRPDVPLRRIHYYLDYGTGMIMKGEQKTYGVCSILPLDTQCYQPFTSDKTTISSLKFFVNNKSDNIKPIVTFVLNGDINVGKETENFAISTSFSPRLLQDPTALPPSDNQPPIVTITDPTTEDTFSTSATSLVLRGTASDNIGIQEMRWRNESMVGAEGASGGAYIWIPNTTTETNGSAEYTFNIPTGQSGDYIVWGLIMAGTGSADEIYVSMDAGANVRWNGYDRTYWVWDKVSEWNGTNYIYDPKKFNLAVGNHTIKFIQREKGFHLDRIIITNDLTFSPGGSMNPSKTYIDFEAEDGTITSPMEIMFTSGVQGFVFSTSPGFATWETPAIPLIPSIVNVLVIEARDQDNVSTDVLLVNSAALLNAPDFYSLYTFCCSSCNPPQEKAALAWRANNPPGIADKYYIYRCETTSSCIPSSSVYTYTATYAGDASSYWYGNAPVTIDQKYCYRLRTKTIDGIYSNYSTTRCLTITDCGYSSSPTPTPTNTPTPTPPIKSFTLSAVPTLISVGVSGSTGVIKESSTSKIKVNPKNGFNSNVSLTASGGPANIQYYFNPQTLLPSQYVTGSTFKVRVPDNTPIGTYTIKIRGSGGSTTADVYVTLDVYATGGGQQ